jgi:malate dehydrogenase (oxaloacetate-decarboxylating)(NADP+)
MGLGCTISGAIRVHDDMFLAAGIYCLPLSKLLIHRNILPPFFDPFTSSKKCHNLTWNILLAAESLASEIGRDHLEKRQLFPAFTEIRDISARIGAAVAEKAYELGTYLMRLYWQLSKFL